MSTTDEQEKKVKVLQVPEWQMVELFQLLYRENLFALISEENYELGHVLLTKTLGIDPGDMKSLGLRFTIDEHLKMASEVLDIHEKTSDFWEIVVRINFIMLSIERNPLLAGELEEIKNVIRRR